MYCAGAMALGCTVPCRAGPSAHPFQRCLAAAGRHLQHLPPHVIMQHDVALAVALHVMAAGRQREAVALHVMAAGRQREAVALHVMAASRQREAVLCCAGTEFEVPAGEAALGTRPLLCSHRKAAMLMAQTMFSVHQGLHATCAQRQRPHSTLHTTAAPCPALHASIRASTDIIPCPLWAVQHALHLSHGCPGRCPPRGSTACPASITWLPWSLPTSGQYSMPCIYHMAALVAAHLQAEALLEHLVLLLVELLVRWLPLAVHHATHVALRHSKVPLQNKGGIMRHSTTHHAFAWEHRAAI